MWLNCRDCGASFTLATSLEEPIPEAQCLACWKKTQQHTALSLLGTMGDASVAALAGRATTTMWYWRHKHHVPAFHFRCRGAYAGRYKEYLAILHAHPGGIHAAEVAREMGVYKEAMRTMLQRLEAHNMVYRFYEENKKQPLWRVMSAPSTNEEPIV